MRLGIKGQPHAVCQALGLRQTIGVGLCHLVIQGVTGRLQTGGQLRCIRWRGSASSTGRCCGQPSQPGGRWGLKRRLGRAGQQPL